MKIEKQPFGEFEGQAVEQFTLENDDGVSVKIMTYGGTVTSIVVPDKKTTGPLKSAGTPQRPAGIRARICSLRTGSSRSAAVLSVAMYPGAIALTLTPLPAHSFASAIVS